MLALPNIKIMQHQALSLLSRIQNQLQSIYEIDVEYDIRDFTITDRLMAETIGSHNHESPEQLLINQQEDCLDISLFLDQSILQNLHEDNPYDQLHSRNLKSYWIAVEGVSHFLYIAWRANFDRQVSQLELELQAEIDKFVCAAELFSHQGVIIDIQALWERLFRNFYLQEHLNAEEIKRYQQANEYAGEYCKYINAQHMKQHEVSQYYKQLRRFYRLGQHAKMAHIATTH